MSTELGSIETTRGEIFATRFFGGIHGESVQITSKAGGETQFIQLGASEVESLVKLISPELLAERDALRAALESTLAQIEMTVDLELSPCPPGQGGKLEALISSRDRARAALTLGGKEGK